MSHKKRLERVKRDIQLLQTLRAGSGRRFDFQGCENSEQLILSFFGKGLARSAGGQLYTVSKHQVALRLPLKYPEQPPTVRWLSPIFHPNVSFSGILDLHHLGVPWTVNCGLDVICERLWDVGRMAWFDLESAANRDAQWWLQSDHGWQLPLDSNPLRRFIVPQAENVISYRRRCSAGEDEESPAAPDRVLYIGPETPVPDLPAVRKHRADNPAEIFYIEEEHDP